MMIGDSRSGCSPNCKTIARVDVKARVVNGLNHKRMAPRSDHRIHLSSFSAKCKDRLQPISTRDEVERRLNKLSLTVQHLNLQQLQNDALRLLALPSNVRVLRKLG